MLPSPRARDQERRVGGFDVLVDDDLPEARQQLRHRNALELVALAARNHRRRQPLALGRGEDELDVLRRLFERLQQAR